jgi:hypothetical protein
MMWNGMKILKNYLRSLLPEPLLIVLSSLPFTTILYCKYNLHYQWAATLIGIYVTIRIFGIVIPTCLIHIWSAVAVLRDWDERIRGALFLPLLTVYNLGQIILIFKYLPLIPIIGPHITFLGILIASFLRKYLTNSLFEKAHTLIFINFFNRWRQIKLDPGETATEAKTKETITTARII